MLVFLRPGAAQSRLVRGLVIAWVAQNVMLVASSALRTIDYVEAYGLTQLRISALIWMGLVGLGLVLICVRLVREKSASWNVRHAREATGDPRHPSLDLVLLRELGPAALVPLSELAARPLPPALAAEVQAAQREAQAELAARRAHWRTWTGAGSGDWMRRPH